MAKRVVKLYCEECGDVVEFDKNGDCALCGTPFAGDEDLLVSGFDGLMSAEELAFDHYEDYGY